MSVPDAPISIPSNNRDYDSLDDMAAKEGVVAVLKFLAYQPTVVYDLKLGSSVYRHTRMRSVPFTVKEENIPFRPLEMNPVRYSEINPTDRIVDVVYRQYSEEKPYFYNKT